MNSGSKGKLKRIAPDKPNVEILDTDQPSDYTASTAKNRTLYINLGFAKFGTTDGLQGAAILLVILLLPLAFTAIVVGFWNSDWAIEVLKWIGAPLMLAVGVAVGRAGSSNHDANE